MNTPRTAPPRTELPWYRPVGDEIALFERAWGCHLPLLLKGPTGCGKSRYVEHMAARLGRELVTVAANDDTSAVDLLGRYLIQGGETVWQDGPVTRAVRRGAILYIDEIAEARSDVVVVLHPLTDHRRQLYIDRTDEVLTAGPDFMLVVSFNPGYQGSLKELKPSTRQRFLGLSFDYPSADVETEILIGETGIDTRTARLLVALVGKLRGLEELGLAEKPSTRLLVGAARLIGVGMSPRAACQAGIIEPLTDDSELIAGLMDVVRLVL
ncbi:MAG: nitric oxide reductase NorQ protein [Myxococcota bacterium]|jgi:nitric oxide reductase NorQ protein